MLVIDYSVIDAYLTSHQWLLELTCVHGEKILSFTQGTRPIAIDNSCVRETIQGFLKLCVNQSYFGNYLLTHLANL